MGWRRVQAYRYMVSQSIETRTAGMTRMAYMPQPVPTSATSEIQLYSKLLQPQGNKHIAYSQQLHYSKAAEKKGCVYSPLVVNLAGVWRSAG